MTNDATDSGRVGFAEVWLPVADFEDRYEVSSFGRVRSLYFAPPRLVSPFPGKDGYPIVGLWRGRQRKCIALHRLVARTFHADKRNALHCEVAHLDGSRDNARADNLKWVSKVENHSHKRIHGTHQSGEKHPRAKLTEADAQQIIMRLGSGETCRSIASAFSVTNGAIEDIRKSKNWRHLPRPIGFRRPRSSGNGQGGQDNHHAKFTAAQAADIRRRRACGETCAELAKEYGVWKGTISKIARGDSYRSSETKVSPK